MMKMSAGTSSTPRSSLKKTRNSADALWYVLLCVAAVAPYLNTLWNGFVYDDIYQVLGNPYIRSFRYLKQILTTSVWSFRYAAQGTTNYYRPLMSLDYLVLYQIYGPLAYGFHLANLLTHAAVVLLLFAVTKRLTGSKPLSFIAAAIFALHPVHVEAVAWVAAIPDLQLALFLLVAFWLYMDLGEAESKRWWTWPALVLTFSLALVCKEPAAAFPFIALAYEYFVRPGAERDRLETEGSARRTIVCVVGRLPGPARLVYGRPGAAFAKT